MNTDKTTILHISDLHRSSENPVSNVALLNSLIRDRDSYTLIGISNPDLLIVSGDIVQGSNNKSILEKQYQEALEFLNELSIKFFDGDKSKIILVPGNHDISWNESIASMELIQTNDVNDDNGKLRDSIFREAIKIDSNIKWSWPDRSFYRVINHEKYCDRLSSFCEFYEAFYDGKRTYHTSPEKQFDIFDIPQIGITIVGFNSCFHNDHLNKAGAINPICIAEVGMELRDFKKQGRLILATWHHNTRGAPYDQDYMDDTFIQNLISDNVKIGFHGHQHKQDVLSEINNVIDKKAMFIISAGSLCAGNSELPPGYNQQYNLIELSRKSDDEIKLKLSSRIKTQSSSFDNPIWETGTFNSTATEFTTTINHPTPSAPSLSKAEKLLGDKDYTAAAKILLQHDINDPIIRVFLLTCYENLDDHSSILEQFSSPKNNPESIALLNAAIEVGTKNQINTILNLDAINKTTDPSVRHLMGQLKSKVK